MAATLARLGGNFGQQGPNFGPTWTNRLQLPAACTHLGATSAQVEVHVASKLGDIADSEILKAPVFTGIFHVFCY